MQRLPDQSILGGYRSSLFLFRQPFLLIPGLLGHGRRGRLAAPDDDGPRPDVGRQRAETWSGSRPWSASASG